MKKLLLLFGILALILFISFSEKGQVIKQVAATYVSTPDYINEEGNTIRERIDVPEGFVRSKYSPGSFQHYLQNYALKPFGAKVINYDGNEYWYQAGHVGVLEIPVPDNGLQQCADALMRIRAEYLWNNNGKDEIGFNFTSGHYCSWKKYSEGYRPRIHGNKVDFNKIANANASEENLYNYLNLVYTYAGTLSLYHELPKITSINELEVGDMLVYPGSPGHIVMIVDLAIHENGEKLFILAQGNTPAQSVHVIKNPNDTSLSPWYSLETNTTLAIPTYHFNETKFIRFKGL